jgi:hypothetical protein
LAVQVELFDDLDAVERDAGGALDRSARGLIFERIEWFRLIERHCPPPGRLLVIRARQGDWQAWLFVKVDGHKAVALANWYSLSFGAIISCMDRHGGYMLTEALIAGLRRYRPRIAAVEFYPLTAGDALSLSFPGKFWLSRVSPATVRWAMNTSGMDFAAYWAERPSRLRNTAARKAKAAALDIQIHTTFSEQGWADYESVYAASWKPEEGSPAFLRALAEMEGEAGNLRLGIASKDGRPVAAQLWLTEGRIATIHKLAYVEDAKALSPGTVLSMEMFRHALDVDRVNGIDFGLGDDAYKKDWIDHSRPMNRLVAYDMLNPRGAWWAAKLGASKLVRRARSD